MDKEDLTWNRMLIIIKTSEMDSKMYVIITTVKVQMQAELYITLCMA